MYGDVCNFNNLLFFFIYDNIKFRYIGLVRGLLGVYMYVECNFYEVIVLLIILINVLCK